MPIILNTNSYSRGKRYSVKRCGGEGGNLCAAKRNNLYVDNKSSITIIYALYLYVALGV